jgi:hypothetical protein
MRLTLVILAFSIFNAPLFGQYKIEGKVELCPNFDAPISIKGRLIYSYPKKRRNKSQSKKLDTLITQISVFKDNVLLRELETNYNGEFGLSLKDSGKYTIKSKVSALLYCSSSFIVHEQLTIFKDCISDSVFHQTFLNQIPYDAKKAKMDIDSGVVHRISLMSIFSGCELEITGLLEPDELERLEKKYGFMQEYFYIDEPIPVRYLKEKEKEYNDVVFSFLDSLNGMDTFKVFREEVINIIRTKSNR